jgi:hypothetical protein
MDLTCFSPSNPSGVFTLAAMAVSFIVGWWARRHLAKKYPDRVSEADQKAKDIGNKLR